MDSDDHATARASEFETALRRAGIRITKQRAAILRALASADDHPDAPALLERAREGAPGLSLATVYRTLSELQAQGVVLKLAFEGEPARFEPADQSHHDHMIDVDTGEVIEFTDERIERLQAEIAAAHGYDIVRHRLDLYVKKRD
ncbi:MAG: Fur family transcriptional regulator [Paracoccus sp. (in: a-proteobacteria)]|nr:Fur family transcriptional regulator [Paracoccus sp. (in: a-proteobacteria)]